MKNPRHKKLDPIPKIHRRLLKLWSEMIRKNNNYKCEYCGSSRNDINSNNKKVKIDAHHLLSKKIKNCPLKYDKNNGIALCTNHHKFDVPSFHKDPITTITWLQEHRPDRYEYILKNAHVRIDLDNRNVLEEIEERLRKGEPLDLDKLKQIEELYPRITKKKIEFGGSLFEEDDPDD